MKVVWHYAISQHLYKFSIFVFHLLKELLPLVYRKAVEMGKSKSWFLEQIEAYNFDSPLVVIHVQENWLFGDASIKNVIDFS